MSVRGVISGLAGSAAVAVVAALSLGTTHATADPKPARAQITPATQSEAAPALRPAVGQSPAQPTWLQRLLSRRDPPMEAPPRKS